MDILTNSKFWFGVIIGLVLCWLYQYKLRGKSL